MICFYCGCFFIGYINSGKEINSDLLNYKNQFEMIPQYNILEYLIFNNRDYLFYFIKYILYYITFGNWNLYLLIITAIPYIIQLSILNLIFKPLVNNKITLLFSLLTVLFFYPLFNYSAHLIRNFFSASIIFWFVLFYFFKRKNEFKLLLSAIFIHSTSLLFFFIYFFRSEYNKRKIISYFVLLLSVLYASFYFFPKFFIFQKVITTLDITDNSSSSMLYLIGMLIFSVLTFIHEFNRIKIINSFTQTKSYFIFFILFCLITMYLDSIYFLISERYLLYIYMLISPMIVLIFTGNKMLNYLARISLFPIILISFANATQNNDFDYGSSLEIISGSLLQYFL